MKRELYSNIIQSIVTIETRMSSTENKKATFSEDANGN